MTVTLSLNDTMTQINICQWIKPACTHEIPFMRLPEDLRRRIYNLSGLCLHSVHKNLNKPVCRCCGCGQEISLCPPVVDFDGWVCNDEIDSGGSDYEADFDDEDGDSEDDDDDDDDDDGDDDDDNDGEVDDDNDGDNDDHNDGDDPGRDRDHSSASATENDDSDTDGDHVDSDSHHTDNEDHHDGTRKARPGDCHFPHNLLLTCRAIYKDLSSVIYSTNRFFIGFPETGDLKALRNLSPHAISSLRYLTVHLNVVGCGHGLVWPIEDESIKQYFDNMPGTPLMSTLTEHQAIISEWRNTASYLMANAKSSALRLNLICDTADSKTAAKILEPLIKGPRKLVNCNIRLSNVRDSDLQTMVQEAADIATGQRRYNRPSHFRFLDLPVELREHILRYTDLITPLGEVEWNPDKGFNLQSKSWTCSSRHGLDIHTLCDEMYDFDDQLGNCWEDSSDGCFCTYAHSAVSSDCHCWGPPTALFLVCREVREQALGVFFRSNRFVVRSPGGFAAAAKTTPDRIEASQFLRDIVPRSGLRHLRFLEIVFPLIEDNYLSQGTEAYRDWCRTIAYAKKELNLAKLTLRVYMADESPHEIGSGFLSFRRRLEIASTKDGSPDGANALFRAFFRMIQPLAKLKGLHRFFVHVSWPHNHIHAKSGYVKRRVKETEKRLEKIVMGDTYDSESMGKREEEQCLWTWAMM